MGLIMPVQIILDKGYGQVFNVRTLNQEASMRVINREDLLSHLWDFNYESFSNVVDVHVKNLRRKLAQAGDPGILETVRGIGYRLRG